MKPLYFCCLISIWLIPDLQAQEILFADNFNDDCTISSEWQVTTTGNPAAVWYIANTPTNTNSDGSTIDGSCMLFMDDDATGDGTDPWTLQLISPTFDATAWTTVSLSIDVHFRNYNGTAFLNVLVFDGSEYQSLRLFQGDTGHTGEEFSQYITYTADLSFFANPDMSIAIEYNDGGDWAWWAGIDNVSITGEGTATNIILENFDDCMLPEGWVNQIIGGEDEWQFGFVDNDNTGEYTSMNGSCFAYFDDDGLTEEAAPSRALLLSPAFDGLAYANYYLDLDVILRKYESLEHLAIGVYDEATGQIEWIESHFADLGGPGFNIFLDRSIDLSAYRKTNMRVAFQYDDGGGWGWWVGLDNIKISGAGIGSDVCSNAIDLTINGPCINGDNRNTLFTGPESDCSAQHEGSIWYRFLSDSDQILQIITNANYNDAVTLFEGSCEALEQKACTNYDEFGFTGEKLIFEAKANTSYYLRLNGYRGEFGLPRGNHCVQIESIPVLPASPVNDRCLDATILSIGTPCLAGNNINANFEGPLPSRNYKSKADIWYQLTTTTANPIEILTHADFADVITVYTGACGTLEEIACGDLGQRLLLDQLSPDTDYLIQLSGYFATLEGSFCIEAREVILEIAENVNCSSAMPILLGEDCVAVNNTGAPFTGPESSCTIFQSASLWFSFEAPTSGKAYLQTEAAFVHAAAIYAGNCGELEEIACFDNPGYCSEPALVEGLSPGQTYWLRLSSMSDFTGFLETGDLCLRILDGATVEVTNPLTLSGYTECYGSGHAQLLFDLYGGAEPYDIQGNANGEILESGTTYVVVVTDDLGCQTSISGTIDCAINCLLSAEVVVLSGNDCPNDYTGAVSVSLVGEGNAYEYLWQDGSTTAALSNIPSGIYTVTVTDIETGCNTIASATVPGLTPYEFDIISVNDPTESIGGSIEIAFSGGLPPYSFEWWTDGDIVSTDQNPSDLLPGTYNLMITDAAGCTFSYDGITLLSPTSTQAVQERVFFNLYPNPTSGRTYVEWFIEDAHIEQLSILNVSGQVIRQYEGQINSPYPLDLDEYPGGIYLIRVQTDKGSSTKKLVLVK